MPNGDKKRPMTKDDIFGPELKTFGKKSKPSDDVSSMKPPAPPIQAPKISAPAPASQVSNPDTYETLLPASPEPEPASPASPASNTDTYDTLLPASPVSLPNTPVGSNPNSPNKGTPVRTPVRPSFSTTRTDAPDSEKSNISYNSMSSMSQGTGQNTIDKANLNVQTQRAEQAEQTNIILLKALKDKMTPEEYDILQTKIKPTPNLNNDLMDAHDSDAHDSDAHDSDNNENDSDIDLSIESIESFEKSLDTTADSTTSDPIGAKLVNIADEIIMGSMVELETELDVPEADKLDEEKTVSQPTTGTSVISQYISTYLTKFKNKSKLVWHEKRANNVKELFAYYYPEIDYEDVRGVAEGGDSTTNQFSNVWGNALDHKDERSLETIAKSEDFCCYLCGGNLVNVKGVTPEMEHKLPAIEFFCKAHNIKKYPSLLGKWHNYISNNNIDLINLYKLINCNTRKAQTEENFRKEIDTSFNAIMDNFAAGDDEISSDKDYKKFKMLLKINLMEFAFSHHTCNQIKSNNNFRTGNGSYQVYKYTNLVTNVIKQENKSMLFKVGNKPKKMVGLLQNDKMQLEQNNIVISSSINNTFIENTMRTLNTYIEKYAELHTDSNGGKLTVKRLMVQSIKGMIKQFKETNDEKITSSIIKARNERFTYLKIHILNKIERFQKDIKIQTERINTNVRRSRSSKTPDKTNDYHNFLLDNQRVLNELNDLHPVLEKYLPDSLTDALTDLDTAKERNISIPLTGGKKPKSKWAIKRKNRTLKKKKK